MTTLEAKTFQSFFINITKVSLMHFNCIATSLLSFEF